MHFGPLRGPLPQLVPTESTSGANRKGSETAEHPLKFNRISAGHYVMGDWTVMRTEGMGPGYEWAAEHPDKGEHYESTKAAAVAVVMKIEGHPVGSAR